MNANYANPPQYAPPPKKKTNWGLIIGVVVVVLLCCCCVGAGALVYFNPLDLEFITPIQETIQDTVSKVVPSGGAGGGGGATVTAKAMPAATGMYAGVRLDKVDKERIDQLIELFGDAMELPRAMRSVDALLDEFDRSALSEIGLSLDDDIRPWVGNTIGIGITDLQMNQYGEPENVSFVAAIEVKDQGKADEFIERATELIAEQSGGSSFATDEYEGVTIYTMESEYSDEPQGALARSGDLLLIGMSEQDVRDAIDAQNGDSLSENSSYTDMMKQVPGNAILSVYVDASQFTDLYLSILEQSDMSGVDSQSLRDMMETQMGAMQGMVLSLAVVDAGIQMDVISAVDMDQYPDEMKEIVKQAGKKPETVGLFPEETVMYAVGYRLDLIWATTRELMATMGGSDMADFEQAMEMAEMQLGFSLDDDLFAHLDGEYAIGLFSDNEGVLASQAGVNMGFAFVAKTSDKNALGDTMDQLAQTIEDLGSPLDQLGSGDINLYGISDGNSGEMMMVFGMARDYMAIASSEGAVEAMFDGGGKLSDNANFKAMLKGLPSGMQPTAFFDIRGLMDLVGQSLSGMDSEEFDQAMAVMEPFTYLAIAGAEPKGDVMRAIMILGIEQP